MEDILSLSESEWLEHKAKFCIECYNQGLAYPPWSEERAQWWLKSIVFFVNEFIRPEFPIPDFHNQWYWWSVKESAYMNISPRDHAKTTVHSIIRVAWEVCVNRNITFFIIFSTTDVAKLIMSQIKSQLTQNPAIRAGFGVFNPKELDSTERTVDLDWSQSSITVQRDDFSVKDPTVAVAGSLTNVLSRRVDRLIVDDLLTDKVAYSEAESERLERWYFNDVQPVLKADGQEIITGTRYKKGDFYHGIENLSLEQDGIYRVFIGDAIVDELEREVLWPDRWPYEALMRQRAKMGSVRFNRNYRNRITSDEDSPFPMVWFTGGLDRNTGVHFKGCYDTSLALGDHRFAKEQLRFVTGGVDPAIGVSRKAKFFALVILGIDQANNLVIVDIVRGKFPFPVQKRMIIDLNRIYQPRAWAVESNAYQQALIQGIEEDAAMVPIVPFHSNASRGQKPDIGVPSMDVYFETGRVRIPRKGSETVKITDQLIEELHYWERYDTSDVAMALWFAFERLKPLMLSAGILPPVRDLIFGDRRIYERQNVQGLAGMPVPRLALDIIRRKARNAPYDHLSPIRNIKSKVVH